nr:hypothetical protein [Tanacetum cinerariifolium]
MASSYNQSITDATSENPPLMLARDSYMKKLTDQGNPTGNPPVPSFERDQEEDDFTSDDKKQFEAYIDAMNEILL